VEKKDITMGFQGVGGVKNAFVDSYTHGLDAKKRLTIPNEWRKLVGEPEMLFVMPSAIERCLSVYPAREIDRRFAKLAELAETDSAAQDQLREISANANYVPWDAQGRIRIKDSLLDYAGLQSDVVMVGVFSRFELWSPEAWKLKQPVIDQGKILAAAKAVGL